jgi:GrpB-like predicted nucleotidyltransferase (UPF0157 family)
MKPKQTHAVSEEYLRSCTIGELARLGAPIALVEYDPQWPNRFRFETARVCEALGERALRVEHVGSTSIPGMIAKPIIDMILVMADSADEAAYVSVLETAGYRLRIREPDWYEHRMFKGGEDDVNLHVFSIGCPEIDRMLAFRDWLRTNEGDRELYARTKRTLAQQVWKYTQNYADAKTAVIDQILLKANGTMR